MGRRHKQAEALLEAHRERVVAASLASLCPLCGRVMPPDQADEHHLVPRSKGGKVTQTLHRICHRQIHALFSEAELAQEYATVEALLAHPEIQTFVRWVQSKPPGFYDRSKRSSRRR